MKVPLQNLANFLNIAPNQLGAMIFCTSLFYKEITIPKRRGGTRTLHVPNNTLRAVQQIIHRDFLGKIQAHEAAQAYVKNKSILTNASKHVKGEFMLKLDIENFFDSIPESLVTNKFIEISKLHNNQISSNDRILPKFTDEECSLLSKICLLDGGLPQGAVTSPHLSNLIFFELDENIKNHCDKLGFIYTRYSDDMIFTAVTDKVFEVEDFVKSELKNIGLVLNDRKTLKLNKNQGKYVTGLFVQNGKIRLTKSRRREIRQELYKYNVIKSINSSDFTNGLTRGSLIGKLEFWKFIEPDCKFVREAIASLTKS